MNRDYSNNLSFTEILRHRNKVLTGSKLNFSRNYRHLSEDLEIAPGSFLIRVHGNSMINAGISSGDTLIVENRGENPLYKIIIAEINGKITLKRLIQFNNDYYLKPENDNYSPIKITDSHNFKIWGIATKVIKDVTDRIG